MPEMEINKLREPRGLLEECLRELSVAAMSVTHHDIDHREPEAIHEMAYMEQKFRVIINRFTRRKSAATRGAK